MKLVNYTFIFIFLIFTPSLSENPAGFLSWKENFKKVALSNNISEKTFDIVMADVRFLPNVIKYDRYQPEFYEDTKTYISKRTSSKKVSKGLEFYKNRVDHLSIQFYLNNQLQKRMHRYYFLNQYNIEKELLLALMGIETNFGTYVGKMDIISSLATLSFDKRRSEFFSNELIILLKEFFE